MKALAVRAKDAKIQRAITTMVADLARARRGRDDENPRAPKAPRQPPPTFTLANRNDDIICSLPFTEHILFPRITKEKDRPCATWYRDGSVCKRSK